jgi:hypothetical protein
MGERTEVMGEEKSCETTLRHRRMANEPNSHSPIIQLSVTFVRTGICLAQVNAMRIIQTYRSLASPAYDAAATLSNAFITGHVKHVPP